MMDVPPLSRVPIASLAKIVDPTGQAIMCAGTLLGTAVLLLFVIRELRRNRTSWVPVTMCLGIAATSFMEPIYDNSYHLLWYIHGQWNLYTAFGIPQPVWIMPAYVSTYGAMAFAVYLKVKHGAGGREFVVPSIICFLAFCLFEIIAIRLGTYEYYGSQPFRFLQLPVWIEPVNLAVAYATGVVCAVAQLHLRGVRRHVVAALAFPFAFGALEFGAGFPSLDLISREAASPLLQWLAASLTIGLSIAAMWITSFALPLVRRPQSEAVRSEGMAFRRSAVSAGLFRNNG